MEIPTDDAPLILAVDTTSERGSVALQRGSELLAVFGSWRPGAHSQKLHEDVDLILRRAGVALEQIALLAVAVGPGSFTGVRVGIASVQGLAHALAKPVVGIGALEALAYSAGLSGTICACRDALRGDLYAQLFRLDPHGTLDALSEPRLVPPDVLVASLEDDPLIFVCDATASLLRALEEAGKRIGRTLISLTHAPLQARGWILLQRPMFLAPAVAALAARRLHDAVPEGATLDALYVRSSDAEVRWRSRADPLPN